MNQPADLRMNHGASPVYCILIAALGGEGGGVLADWLVQCASSSGLPVQATSVPGVAQRTGATSYYVEMLRTPLPAGAAAPVFALSPVPGRVDVVIASELLEAARMMERGFVTNGRTTLIASTHRVYTTLEKMHMADGRHDSARIRRTAEALAARLALIDMDRLATEAGTVVSAVMFGALSGAGVLPWPRALCESVIAGSGRGAEASLAGFALAHEAVAAARSMAQSPTQTARQSPVPSPVPSPVQAAMPSTMRPTPPSASQRATLDPTVEKVFEDANLPASLRDDWRRRINGWPAPVQSIASHGAVRCRGYQGDSYASMYLDRVDAMNAAAMSSASASASMSVQVAPDTHEALAEAVRHLALWMCFEDVIRVADLKSRRQRVERVRRDVQAGAGEVIRVTEYFKPGVDEIAAVLPAAIGSALLSLAARRGWTHSFVGLHIRSTSLWGHLMLRGLARLRPFRPMSLRYGQEQVAMEAWLAAMHHALRAASPMALALAGMPQVIKGYGDTQRRGRENYARLWAEHIATALTNAERMKAPLAAAALQQAIRATLADPEGKLNIASQARGEAKPMFWARVEPAESPRSAKPSAVR